MCFQRISSRSWRLSPRKSFREPRVGARGVHRIARDASGCSALHHAVQRPVSPPIQLLLRRMDHTSIYLFIAGSYTPVCIVGGLHPFWSKVMLSVVWALAGAGVYQKLFLDLGSKARYLTISTYLLQGWCCSTWYLLRNLLIFRRPSPGMLL